MKIPKILLTIALVFSSFFPLAASIRTLDFQQKPHLGHFSEFSPNAHPVTVVYLLKMQQGTELVWCTMHIDPTDNMVNGFSVNSSHYYQGKLPRQKGSFGHSFNSGNELRIGELVTSHQVDKYGKAVEPFFGDGKADKYITDKRRRGLGQIAHTIIQFAHKITYGAIFDSWHDSTMTTIGRDIATKEKSLTFDQYAFGSLRPDIAMMFEPKKKLGFKCNNVMFWEIKPDNKRQITRGKQQLKNYVSSFDRSAKRSNMKARSFIAKIPFPPTNVKYRSLSVRYKADGLILYNWNLENLSAGDWLRELKLMHRYELQNAAWVGSLIRDLETEYQYLDYAERFINAAQLLLLLGTGGRGRVPVPAL